MAAGCNDVHHAHAVYQSALGLVLHSVQPMLPVMTVLEVCKCVLLQDGDARQELHALGFVDGHEGQQSLSVKFYLQLDSQNGSDMGTNRYTVCMCMMLYVWFAPLATCVILLSVWMQLSR